MTSKTYTIRGKMTLAARAVTDYPVEILSYQSPDRTRAWKVRKFWMWPVSTRTGDASFGKDGQLQLDACLTTDSWLINDFTTVTDPSENRSCAWLKAGYKHCEVPLQTSFIADQSRGTMAEGIIDEDRLITDRLYIAAQTTTEDALGPAIEWGYMIVLDQVKVSPLESVIQMLKGVGQDISN